jgi:S-adenosylmethionine-diacylgycerolhomoserine-N-methlytransferase
MTLAGGKPAHTSAAAAMDRMYRWQLSFYDLTRKPYLLGRDRLIGALAPPFGSAVLEIGCGTGRNLIAAARKWPHARFYGYDVSRVMIDHARRSVQRAGLDGRITLAQGDACSFDPRQAFHASSFERVYFSYVLSMVPPWREALAAAVALLEPGASLHIADFGDQHNLGLLQRAALNRWLAIFHVEPRLDLATELESIANERGLRIEIEQIYRGYAVVAALRRPSVPLF